MMCPACGSSDGWDEWAKTVRGSLFYCVCGHGYCYLGRLKVPELLDPSELQAIEKTSQENNDTTQSSKK